MKKGYLGIDVGSISTKGVIIDEEGNIISSHYMWTNGNPIEAVKSLVFKLKNSLNKDIKIKGVGVTGSARKLIGTILGANLVKNEITAHAVGTLHIKPDTRTILEIGGQDSKIIIIDDGVVVDYAMNTLCAAGTGSFLSSQAKRLGVEIEDIGNIAISSKNPSKIAARCTVFAESDLVHKIQAGHKKEDIIAGLCKAVVGNYLNNIGKGKKILAPIVFQGGVSKNIGVVEAFKEELGTDVYVDPNGHLMGALGVALLSKNEEEIDFDFNIVDLKFTTSSRECSGCPNNCEVIIVKKGNEVIDSWGNKCERGALIK